MQFGMKLGEEACLCYVEHLFDGDLMGLRPFVLLPKSAFLEGPDFCSGRMPPGYSGRSDRKGLYVPWSL